MINFRPFAKCLIKQKFGAKPLPHVTGDVDCFRIDLKQLKEEHEFKKRRELNSYFKTAWHDKKLILDN